MVQMEKSVWVVGEEFGVSAHLMNFSVKWGDHLIS